jgi:hypothetical protein
LIFQEASSVFNADGTLHPDAIAGSSPIIEGAELRNPHVIAGLTSDGSALTDWNKYATAVYSSNSGRFQVHFYKNTLTDEIAYDIDYKSKIQ